MQSVRPLVSDLTACCLRPILNSPTDGDSLAQVFEPGSSGVYVRVALPPVLCPREVPHFCERTPIFPGTPRSAKHIFRSWPLVSAFVQGCWQPPTRATGAKRARIRASSARVRILSPRALAYPTLLGWRQYRCLRRKMKGLSPRSMLVHFHRNVL